MKRHLVTSLLSVLALATLACAQTYPPAAPGNESRALGIFYAPNYAYGFGGVSAGSVQAGNASTGAATITLRIGYIALPDGRKVVPFSVTAPILIGNGTNQESVTPTAVSGCYPVDTDGFSCQITGSFSNLHGRGEAIFSGTYGLQEAINDAFGSGGGKVVVDSYWSTSPLAGTNAILSAAIVYPSVAIEDDRGSGVQYWNVQQTASTFLAVPTTLTAVTALPSATPVGAYGTGTYHLCIAYVDVAGQEGACSADFSEAGLATGSFIFSAPAASAGAVGYTIYISLTSGTYSLAYQVPLTSTVCALTKIETITPACAVANTTYGQSGATATVTAITVNTSPVGMQLGGVSGTLLTGNPNGRTTYSYVPSSHLAANAIPTANLAFTAGGIGSATPISIGTVNLPAGVLNYVGKTIRVCGKYLNTDVNSSTQIIDAYWDAPGSNVAGSPVKLSALTATGTGTAAAYEGSFCENFVTTVSGAGATAGSLLPGFGILDYALVSTGNVVGNGADTQAAAVGSLNLAGTAGFSSRLSIIHNNATGNATPQLQSLSIEVI